MSLDFTTYLSEIQNSLDDVADKHYVDTTSKYPSEDQPNNDKYGDTISMLLENISRSKNTLLIGKPGSGKSTSLKRLLIKLADHYVEGKNQKLPVLIELRRVGRQSSVDGESISVYKLIMSKLCEDKQQVRQLLKSGELVLLLDGLNEVPANSKGLYDFISDYPNTTVVITTREFGHESHLSVDSIIRLQPLKKYQSYEFIKQRFSGTQNSIDELLMQKHEKLRELTEIPLFLDMLCETYQLTGHVAENIGELFRSFTKSLYSKHKPSISLVPRSDDFFDFCHEILQELAFLMMHAGGDAQSIWLQVSKDQAQLWLEERFAERGEMNAASKAKQWIDDAIRLHLLQQTDEAKVEFVHQLFQEYYAAEWLLRHYDDLTKDQLIAHYFNLHKWTEPILILAGLQSTRSNALAMTELAISVDLTLAARLSGRVQGEFQLTAFEQFKGHLHSKVTDNELLLEIIGFNQTKYWADFVVDYLENPEQNKIRLHHWFKYSKSLSLVNCDRTVEYFRSILVSKGASDDLDDRDMVRESLRLLIGLGDVKGIVSFVTKQVPKPISSNIESALAHLGNVKDPRYVPLFISLLEDENIIDPYFFSLIRALGQISSEEAVDKLIATFKSENLDLSRRKSAIEALQDYSGKHIFQDMLGAVLLDEGFVLPASSYLKIIDFHLAEQWLIVELKKRTGQISRLSLSLSNMQVDITNKFITKDVAVKYAWRLRGSMWDRTDTQVNLILALGYIDSKKSIPKLKNLYRSSYWRIRKACVDALGMIACPSLTEFLIEALKDQDSWVKSSVVNALGRIPTSLAAQKYINEVLADKNERNDFCCLITEMQYSKNFNPELVLAVFESGDKFLIERVRSVLWGSFSGLEYTDRLVEAMIYALNNSDKELQRSVYYFLKHINQKTNSTKLGSALNKLSDVVEREEPSKLVKELNQFEGIDNAAKIIKALEDSESSTDHEIRWKKRRDAKERVRKVARVDDLALVCEYSHRVGDMGLLYDVQSKLGFYDSNWYFKSQLIPFISEKNYTGARCTMNNNFYGNVTGNVFGDNSGTINNKVEFLSSNEDSELKRFLQEWKEQERQELKSNPEASAQKAVVVFNQQNPIIVNKLQAGSASAITSLMTDLAIGERFEVAFVKAFFAFVGAAAIA